MKLKTSLPLRLAAPVALAVSTFPLVASAQTTGIDVAAVVTEIGNQATPIAAIGGAVLLIFVAVKAFKWVRKALS